MKQPQPDVQAVNPAPAGLRWSRRLKSLTMAVFLACVAVGLIAAGTLLLHSRANNAGAVLSQEAIIVRTDRVVRQRSYLQQRRFVGRVEPVRQTALAFERAGRLLDLQVQEGQVVKNGAVIARLDSRSLRARRQEQRASRRALETDRELAVLESKRQRKLKGDGYASGQAVDAARLRVAGLDARLAQIDAAMMATRIDLTKTILRSPFDATVGELFYERGSALAAGAPVLTLFDQAAPQVRVGVPPNLTRGLKSGDQMMLQIDNKPVPARLVNLRPDLDARTRTVGVIFEISSPPATRRQDVLQTQWVFGQTAELLLQDTVTVDGFWLPLTALKEGERGLWTMLTVRTAADSQAPHVLGQSAVEVLHIDGVNAYVRGGPGDRQRYVTTGLHRLTAGQSVRLEATSSGRTDS